MRKISNNDFTTRHYIDTLGNFSIEPRFSNGGIFLTGLAPVQLDNKWGYINKKGDFVIPCKYQLAYPFQNPLGVVWEDDYPKYINQDGKIVGPVFVEDNSD